MAEISMDTDWGANGAQLTGAQVQAFIKGQLQSLGNRIDNLQNNIDDNTDISAKVEDLKTQLEDLNEKVGDADIKDLAERINSLEIAADVGEAEQVRNSTYLQAVGSQCMVAYTTAEGRAKVLSMPWWRWADAIKENPDISPVGVVVMMDGYPPIVVHPFPEKRAWSLLLNKVEAAASENTIAAYRDMNGKQNTIEIMLKSEELGFYALPADAGEVYAAPYCSGIKDCSDYNTYPQSCWWLPTLGELTAIRKNLPAINRCLKSVQGFTEIDESAEFWTSNDYDGRTAFSINLQTGLVSQSDKAEKKMAWPITYL